MRHLTLWVLLAAIAGWLVAALAGDPLWVEQPSDAPGWYAAIVLLKQAFLSLLKMLVAPVVFFSLVSGIASLGTTSAVGRLGSGTALWYLSTTALATVVGLLVVLWIHPWEAAPSPNLAGNVLESARLIDPDEGSLAGVMSKLLGQALVNPFSALATQNIVAIVVSAIALGIAIVVAVPTDSPLRTALQDLTQAIYRVLSWVVLLMPVGVFAIVFDLTLGLAGGLLPALVAFVSVVVGATLFHGLIVLPALAWIFAGIRPDRLLSSTGRALLVAFTTSSSAATLPVSMQVAEENLGVPRPMGAFILPLGATMNMDGTALFEGIAAIFLAWLFGIELSTLSILVIFAMAMVSSIGAPGMPSGSMSGMQIVLLAAGIPLEAIGILLLVERPLDTIRTAVNVEGDLIGCAVLSRWLRPREAAAP